MARERFAVADSDMHVIEPADLWINYIEPQFKARAPVGLTEVPRDVAIEWEGKRIPNRTPLSRQMLRVTQTAQADRYEHAERRGYDAVSQLEAMEREGLDVAVLFPSRGLFALAVDGMDRDLAAAIARAYNDWLAQFCAEDPERLLGAAMLPPHDVAAAVAEARRMATEFGFKATFMRPNPINGRYWHHASYDPLWAELERLGVPICFHEGGSGDAVHRADRQAVRPGHHGACREPLARDDAGVRQHVHGRRPRAISAPPRRLPRRQLRLGALAPLADGRARRVARRRRGPGPRAQAERVLSAPVLGIGRARRDACAACRGDAGRQHRLLHGLPARRLQVPAGDRTVLEATATCGDGSQDPLGQLGAPLHSLNRYRGGGTP